MALLETLARRWGTIGTIIATALVALAINLVAYAIGTLAGGSFDFTVDGASEHVYALLLAAFTVIPIVVGLTLVALLARWWHQVIPLALVIAPILAIGTIFIMTLPADLDTASTVTLAITHVVVAIVTVAGVLALRGRRPGSAFQFA
jgi:membrane associated rhomboid family serine protease